MSLKALSSLQATAINFLSSYLIDFSVPGALVLKGMNIMSHISNLSHSNGKHKFMKLFSQKILYLQKLIVSEDDFRCL